MGDDASITPSVALGVGIAAQVDTPESVLGVQLDLTLQLFGETVSVNLSSGISQTGIDVAAAVDLPDIPGVVGVVDGALGTVVGVVDNAVGVVDGVVGAVVDVVDDATDTVVDVVDKVLPRPPAIDPWPGPGEEHGPAATPDPATVPSYDSGSALPVGVPTGSVDPATDPTVGADVPDAATSATPTDDALVSDPQARAPVPASSAASVMLGEPGSLGSSAGDAYDVQAALPLSGTSGSSASGGGGASAAIGALGGAFALTALVLIARVLPTPFYGTGRSITGPDSPPD